MADYYTNFSCLLAIPREHKDLVKRLLVHEEDPIEVIDFPSGEESPQFGWQWEGETVHGGKPRPEDEWLWIYSDGCGNVDDVCAFVAYVQKRFQLDEPFVIEWSNSCSKPRLDAFGGGVCIVYRGKESFMNTGTWRDRFLKKLEKRKCDK